MAGSPALPRGACLVAPMVPGSQRVAPRLIPKMDPAVPTQNPAHDPGLNLALAGDPGVTTAALAPVPARTADARAAGLTVANDATEAIAAPPCPTAAGTLATGQILTLTPVWECLV